MDTRIAAAPSTGVQSLDNSTEEINSEVQKRRILCYVSTRLFEGGGLSAVTLNYCRQIWKLYGNTGELTIDFVSHGRLDPELLEEIESHGGFYYELPKRMRNPIRHTKLFEEILRNSQYDVLHFNYDSGFDAIELFVSRPLVPVRICHIHNPNPRHSLVNKLLKNLAKHSYTKAVACSRRAGESFFGLGSDFTILNNAIELDKYAYSESTRQRMRNELMIPESSFVVGHVGRMNRDNAKNHGFLIKSFSLAVKRKPNLRLILVGSGDLLGEWKKLVSLEGIEENVVFEGFKTNIQEYLQSFDLFCFPSRWEGLGMAAIEAQAAGLPCLVSTQVPSEARLTGFAVPLSVSAGYEQQWADTMIEYSNRVVDRYKNSHIATEEIANSGYDIRIEAITLAKMYGLHVL